MKHRNPIRRIMASSDSVQAKVLKITGLVAAGIAFGVLVAFLFGFVFKALWNWLMPDLFGLRQITFWQAFGIIVLAKILFGSMGHSHGKSRQLAADPGASSFYREFWETEGRAAFTAYLERKKAEKQSIDQEAGG